MSTTAQNVLFAPRLTATSELAGEMLLSDSMISYIIVLVVAALIIITVIAAVLFLWGKAPEDENVSEDRKEKKKSKEK